MIDGCDRLTDGAPIKKLEAERDDLLLKLIDMLDASDLWHVGNPDAKK